MKISPKFGVGTFLLALLATVCMCASPLQTRAASNVDPYFDAVTHTLYVPAGEYDAKTLLRACGAASYVNEIYYEEILGDITVSGEPLWFRTNSYGIFACPNLVRFTTHGKVSFKNTKPSEDYLYASRMFCYVNGCSKLKTLDLSSFSFSEFGNIDEMFYGCSSLESINFGSIDTSKVTSMQHCFAGCSSLRHIDLSSFDLSSLWSAQHMFQNCVSLQSVSWASAISANPVSMQGMFYNCPSLEIADISPLIPNNTDNPFSSTSPRCILINTQFATKAGIFFVEGTYDGYATKDHSGPSLGKVTFTSAGGELNTYAQNHPEVVCFYSNDVTELTYMSNGGSWDGSNKQVVGSVNNGWLSTAPWPEKEGYRFSGWTTDEAGTTPLHTPQKTPDSPANPFAYAQWTINQYDYTFSSGIGVFGDGKTIKNVTQDFATTIAESTVGIPTKTDDMFLYWKDQNAFKRAFPITVKATNESLQAVFLSEAKNVLVDAGEGTFPDGSHTKEIYISDDTYIEESDLGSPKRDGYTFLGWADESGKPLAFPYFFTGESLSLQALWKESSNGWVQDTTGWRYSLQGEYVANAWLWIDDTYGAHWYYFNEDTYMATNQWQWDEENSSWYWLCGSGPMIQGIWQWIDNQWYGFWWNGKMCRGWVWDSDWKAWFYCYNNGIMARSAWIGRYWTNWRGIWIR